MTTTSEITMTVPIGELARDHNPKRQVRTGGINGIDVREIERLYTQENPDTWGEIIVRPWPENELDQRPDDGVKYQVMIGNHRYVTARDPIINEREFNTPIGLNLSAVTVIVRNWDDATYFRESYQSNRGPAPLTAEDKASAVKRMQALYPDASQGDLAKMLNVTKSYVQAALSGRDTNAARSKRQSSGERREENTESSMRNASGDQQLPTNWQVAAADLDAKRLMTVGQALADLFACASDTNDIMPADVRGYVASLRPHQRRDDATMAAALAAWLANYQIVLAQAATEMAEMAEEVVA